MISDTERLVSGQTESTSNPYERYKAVVDSLYGNPSSPRLSMEAAFLNQRLQLRDYQKRFGESLRTKETRTDALPGVSVIINTYDRIKTLPLTLQALKYQDYSKFEVVVVDGPSGDGTREYIYSHWQDKIKFATTSHANLSISRNLGISMASGDIIAFIDDDAVPERNWITELARPYQDPKVGAVGGWVYNHTGTEYQSKWIISKRDSRSSNYYENEGPNIFSKPFSYQFPAMIGVNSSFRRSTLYRAGGFDESYAYFLDETDVCARITDLGYKIVTNPAARVHHKYAPSHLRDARRIPKEYLREATSIGYYLAKNISFDRSLQWATKVKEGFLRELCGNADRLYAEGLISKEHANKLQDDAKTGLNAGFTAALDRPGVRNPSLTLPTKRNQQEFPTYLRTRQVHPLSIVFATDIYPPLKCGGVAVFINQLAKGMAHEGHVITVITKHTDPSSYTIDFEDNVWVHRIGDAHINSTGQRADPPANMPDLPPSQNLFALAVHEEIKKYSEMRRFDYAFASVWDVPLIAVAGSGFLPVITEMATFYGQMKKHKPEWTANKEYYNNHVKKMMDAEFWLVKNSQIVLATTFAIQRDFEREYSFKIPEQQLRRWPLGIADIKANEFAVRNKSTSSKCCNILFVGRLEQRKGILDLLHAIPIVFESCPFVRFQIVGEDLGLEGLTYESRFLNIAPKLLENQIVQFLGYRDDLMLLKHYEECDIFVAPSEYESFGIIYLEAMRFSKPCVGTRIGGIPEVVQDGVTGLLCEPKNPNELAQFIVQLAINPEMRLNMGNKGRERFCTYFTADSMVANLESILYNDISDNQYLIRPDKARAL